MTSNLPRTPFSASIADGAPFGPFVCRNHYPDYIGLCAGLAVGLLTTSRNRATIPSSQSGSFGDAALDLLQRPAVLAVAAGIGLMLASIPFSHSRGGMLAVLAALLGTAFVARRRTFWLSAIVALAAVSWVGWPSANGSDRFIDDRTPLWKTTLLQMPGFWLGGAGNGSHLRIEPLGRSESERQPVANAVAEHAHNEYLEAAVEGGLPRFAITLALPVFVLTALARGYRRSRGNGLSTLGVWFGVAAVAAHAVTDFALHIPAVALLAIIAAAFALTASEVAPRPPGAVFAGDGRSAHPPRDPRAAHGPRPLPADRRSPCAAQATRPVLRAIGAGARPPRTGQTHFEERSRHLVCLRGRSGPHRRPRRGHHPMEAIADALAEAIAADPACGPLVALGRRNAPPPPAR